MKNKWLNWIKFKARPKMPEPVEEEEEEEVQLLSYIVINHTESTNRLLREVDEYIDLSENNRMNYYKHRLIPAQVKRIVRLHGNFLKQNIHRLNDETEEHESQMPEDRKEEDDIDWKALLEDWPESIGNVPINYLFEYVPLADEDNLQTFGRTERQKHREVVWSFKSNHPQTTPRLHVNAMYRVMDPMTEKLLETFKGGIQKLTFFCIPASTLPGQWRRYHEFSREMCRRTGMQDSFTHVKLIHERKPTHEGGDKNINFTLDRRFFYGKRILLFDDICTTGSSVIECCSILEDAGAIPTAAFFIGRTREKKKEQNQ